MSQDKLKMCEIVGEYSELNSENLPTHLEVIKYYYFEYEKMYQKNRRYPLFSVVSKLVLDEVENIWSSTSIPIVLDQWILTMIKIDHDAVNLLHRYPAKNRNEKFIHKLNSFKDQGLFSIACIGENVKRLKSFCGKKTLPTTRVGNVFYLILGWWSSDDVVSDNNFKLN